jgi:hypothetical protein
MEGELLEEPRYRSPPTTPVIDMSAYDLRSPVLPALSLPVSELYPELSPIFLPPVTVESHDNPPSAALVSQPAPAATISQQSTGSTRLCSRYFPIFDKRVNNS